MGGGTAFLPPPPPPPPLALSSPLLPSLGLRHQEASAETERVFRATRIAGASTRLQRENATAIREYYKLIHPLSVIRRYTSVTSFKDNRK